MKTTIKSVSKINAYGFIYYTIRYLSGREKRIEAGELSRTVYRFIAEAPFEFVYKDRDAGWHETRWSLFPVQF